MDADFSGYATRAGIRCSDGRTITKDAFKHNDGAKVPLVWQHGHSNPNNVLGHALLENRDDGVYAYGFFNATDAAKNAKQSVEHGDINALSIYANHLQEENGNVMHGEIREVSLVLSGANPGARIDNVYLRHSDGHEEPVEGEAVIYGGQTDLMHADEEDEEEYEEDLTVEEVLDSLTPEQRQVVEFLVGKAATEAGDEDDEDDEDDSAQHSDNSEGDLMHKNIFEENDSVKTNKEETAKDFFSHADVKAIFEDAQKNTKSLHDSILAHVESKGYGVDNIEFLFPEAKAITNTPEFISRDMEWVSGILSGTKKLPFSRIKSLTADITHEEARARGYITGNMKKEEFFGLAKRETHPTTIYKKQKLDRDDIIDVTTMDVVAWLWAEMRVMLNEEIARAILIGDGRDVEDEDKIDENKIRPIATDHEFYTHKVEVDPGIEAPDFVDEVIRAKKHYKGSGNPTFYASGDLITEMMLVRDQLGRKMWRTEAELAAELGVSKIVRIPLLDDDQIPKDSNIKGLRGIIVNLGDYNVGTDRGGEISRFDDFDIDFNQYKYLLEGRMSGALTKHKSAVAIYNTGTFVEAGEQPEPIDHKQVENPLSNHPKYRPGKNNRTEAETSGDVRTVSGGNDNPEA
nr:MAG TPA: major capsid protein [Caudoviricetes sp.]